MSYKSYYLHGTSPEEQQRLTLLNTVLLNGACLKELALKGGEKIIDVGSGLGQFTRAMAGAAHRTVVGIERSEEQIAEAINQGKSDGEEQLVEYRRGDARKLPLGDDEWGTFDVAHARFVLEHVPDPLNVVKEMVKAVKPGGRIVLADDDHEIMRLHPDVPGFDELGVAYMKSFQVVGNDPFIGRRLTSLLLEAGTNPVRNTWVFFGSCAGHNNFDAYAYNLITVICGARELMVDKGLIEGERFDQIVESLELWRRKPDAALWYAVNWAEGLKK